MSTVDDAEGHLEGKQVMTHQSIVVILDDTCRERQFTKLALQNGIHTNPRNNDEFEGILAKPDINLLLTMFDTVITTPSSTQCLSILLPKISSPVPLPTLFLIPLSPGSLSPPTTPLGIHDVPSESSSRSSASHKKHPQSDSSENTPLTYGPEFLSLLQSSPHGAAHIVPVALCRQGESWSVDNLRKLADLGIRDILTVPCEPANVGGLYMHLKDRVLNPLNDTIALQRYQKSSRASQSRREMFSSWMENDSIIDVIVQSYAPQPNLLSRSISSAELLSPVTSSHLANLADKVNDWDFHAGQFEYEDLIWSSVLILEHVLNTGGEDLSPYKISRDELVLFMLTVRSCYQPTNHYHNFRHAIDVLQATYQILLLSNIIPPIPSPNASNPPTVTPLLPPSYITPIEVLSLCIAAVGHDAAHPGVTNAFLAASKSSLATLFNERSVLENLHCLTISRIIHDRWPSLFSYDQDGRIRKLILEMILSTDMALHFDFMARFESIRNSIITTPTIEEKQRGLICCCIMKSADISNLARPLNISTDWTLVLQQEISAQEDLIDDLKISLTQPMSPTTTRGTTLSATEKESQLAKSQLGFIDIFAEPLWNIGATAFFPGMMPGVEQIRENKQAWIRKINLPPNPLNGNSSISTVASTEGRKSDGGTEPTAQTSMGEIKGPPVNDEQKRGVRNERSFSSLRFWKKKGRQQRKSE